MFNCLMAILMACFLVAYPYQAQKVGIKLVDENTIQARLERGLVGPSQRQSTIRSLFESTGCAIEEQPVRKSASNVICTFPGETEDTILVGAHFVAFASEEDGMIGSSAYVKKLTPEQKSRVKAMVNLECLGTTPTKVWVHRSAPALVERLLASARSLHLDLKGSNVEQIGDDDTHAFARAKIPVISIHSITQETLPVLHSDLDRESAIRFSDYYNSYKLIALYLAVLDEMPSAAPGRH